MSVRLNSKEPVLPGEAAADVRQDPGKGIQVGIADMRLKLGEQGVVRDGVEAEELKISVS